MELMIYNPAHPKDKTRAKPLTPAQFGVVAAYIVERMNTRRKKIDEAVILQMLRDAGVPLAFDA